MLSLSTTLTLSLSWTQTDSNALSSQNFTGTLLHEKTLDNYLPGSGLDRAGNHFSEVNTLAAGASKVYDLQSLTGVYLSGNIVFGLDRVKILAVRNLSEDSGYNLQVGGYSSNPFTGYIPSGAASLYVGADSDILLSSMKNGFVVSASSRYLQIKNPNASGVNYHIVIIGQSG